MLLAAFGNRWPTRDVTFNVDVNVGTRSREELPTPVGENSVIFTSCPGGTTSLGPSWQPPWQPWRRIARSSSGPLAFVLAGYAELVQTRYQAWRRKHRREELPEHFHELLTQVIAFTDPAVSRGAAQLTWRAFSVA